MMGLLIKDFKLLKQQRNMFIVMLVISFMLVMTNNDVSFVMSYLTFIATFFVISTISYDDYNKSNLFLFTLPVTRKEYTLEKYFLGFGACISVWLLSTIGCTIYKMNVDTQFILIEWIGMALLILCIPLFTLSFMIPVQLKYGGEKGRIAMIAVVGIVFLVGFGIVMLCRYLNINLDMFLSDIHDVSVLIGAIMITLFTNLISYCISLRIMKNKEF